MRTIKSHLKSITLTVLLAFTAVLNANASAKAGEATVYEGGTVNIALADTYRRTLMRATDVSYQWYSESSSYASVVSSTRYNATVKGVKATSSCKVYFKCSYFLDGYFRTMDFYYKITVLSTNISVTSVTLSQSSATITEGNKLQLTASVYPTNATNKNVNWSSSNTSVATVNSYGLVSAKSAGTSTITCRAADGSGKYATCKVYVESATVYVSSISLNKTSATLSEGETLQLSASVNPSTATNKSLSWSTDDASVATVSGSGLVTAKSAGSATITCKAKDGSGKYAKCTVTVKEKVKPAAITLSQQSATLVEGETLQLKATVSPEGAEDAPVTWISDNSDVATVESNGLVRAKRTGVANIIATTSNNLAAVCAITVKEKSDGRLSEWKGHYKVSSTHVESSPTRIYPDNFDMIIEDKDGTPYITSMFGDDLTEYNDGGFKLKDNGDGTATVDVSYYNILKYTDNNSPLYTIYVFDEAADDWADSWTLKMNDDGSVSLGDFYVAAFTWEEAQEKWADGQLEALYYRLTAKKADVSGIIGTAAETPRIQISNGAIRMDEVTDVTVCRDNGAIVYSGRTNCIENLPRGLYIVRIGTYCKKILMK